MSTGSERLDLPREWCLEGAAGARRREMRRASYACAPPAATPAGEWGVSP
jgi:hypothetical protein